MAAAIFDALSEDAGLDLRARSAGVSALEGAPMDQKVRSALEELGIYPGEHRSRQVDREMIETADPILVMSPRQLAKIRLDFGDAFELYTLPGYVGGAVGDGVPDPRGGSMLAYRASTRQLFDLLEPLVERLAERSHAEQR